MYTLRIKDIDKSNCKCDDGVKKLLTWCDFEVLDEDGEFVENVKSVTVKMEAGGVPVVVVEIYHTNELIGRFPDQAIIVKTGESGPTIQEMTFAIDSLFVKTTEPFANKVTIRQFGVDLSKSDSLVEGSE